jgi:hypothetical protein
MTGRAGPVVVGLTCLLMLAADPAATQDNTAEAEPEGVQTETAGAAETADGAAPEADPQASRKEAARQICRILQSEAETTGIPAGFLARLIWTESRFNPDAVSPKGAQGIAQFMPGTAAERALSDPFDIPAALAESAAFLRELADAFGNVGLAAAAYNAGPRRVENWLAGRATLPWETLNFVMAITGLPAGDWMEMEIEMPDFTLDEALPFEEACIQLAMAGRPRLPAAERAPDWRPWGVQVAAHFSRSVALAAFSRVKSRHASTVGDRAPMVVQDRAPARGRRALFTVRIGADTRDEAQEICARLRSAGGACLVMKN